MKLWMRLNADSIRDPRLGELADKLGIPVAHAFGMVVAVWCAMAEHAPNGDLSHVSDSTIDHWAFVANTTGHARKPRFAEAFRASYLDETGRDLDFERNQGALVERARKSRMRMAMKASKDASDCANPSRSFREIAAKDSRVRNGTTRNEPPNSVGSCNVLKKAQNPVEIGVVSRGKAMHIFAEIRSARVATESMSGTRYHIPRAFLETLDERTRRAVEDLGGASVIAMASDDKLTILRAQFALLMNVSDVPGTQ